MDTELTKTDDNWEKPDVKDLGEAKDIIEAVNELGGGDAMFDLLIST